MKNYKHIRHSEITGTEEVLEEWRKVHKDSFYDINTARERMSPALSKTRSYYLRVPSISPSQIVRTESTQHIIECNDVKLFALFPKMHGFINRVGKELFGGWTILGRVFVTRLDPSESIGRHIDEGNYFERLHRFHLPLSSNGARFMWDDDSIWLREGELWRVNNSVPHWVENGDSFRTHLIFDAC